jgi:succinate dehydrogenase / fumarate reductase flavoprotein subunit
MIMNDLVGIIRDGDEMRDALAKIDALKPRIARAKASGGREYNPGWHLALDLPKQILVSECIARAALTREESRGGHTRNDFAKMDPEWRKVNLVCSLKDGKLDVQKKALPSIPKELIELFDPVELSKYMTTEELNAVGMA